MDRRSWLWRRKSSSGEKSPSGETESSGSVSSHSERFSDEQTLLNHNVQSSEVTSKDAQGDGTVKTLSEKLSQALLNIRVKEDLVKQHAKVAEEAVSGWERAENEVLALKKQNDALTQKNTSLNERADHLDGALKECLRELRQARDEQEEKIHYAITKKNREWESNKSQLENQLAKTDTNNADIRSKLEALEKENSILKLKLVSKAEELALTTKERDLSTRAAETASKQHLDSIKRVAKFEAECRSLKATARKATIIGNESLTDSQPENGERILVIENDGLKTRGESIDSEPCRTRGKSLFCPSVEIELMDDFLEMERLVAISEMHIYGERVDGRENALRDELEAMVNRMSELEENLKKINAEKVSLEIALNECQIQLNASQDRLNRTMAKLVDMKMQLAMADEEKRDAEKEVESTKVKLKNSTKLLDEAELTMVQIQDGLTEAKRRVEAELEDANVKKAEAESRLKVRESELETFRSSICTLEREVEKEKCFSREVVAKCNILEAEVWRIKLEDSQFQRSAIVEEFRINQDKELAVAASMFAECRKTIASLDRQLKSLATFEDFMIDTEIPVAVV